MRNNQFNLERSMPILFIGHGSPMNAIQKNDYTNCLGHLGQSLPTPKAILVISAHWMTDGTWLTHMSNPKTIHDFYGFPDKLFQIQYSAPGNPVLAEKIRNTIKDVKINLDESSWGLDHGAWSVLCHMYPKANIPVVQLSLDMAKPADFHFKLGKELKFLRKEGVLVLASGNIVHNLRKIKWEEGAPAYDWALVFDEWVKNNLIQRNFSALLNDVMQSEAGRLSVPTQEHYYPLLYVLGAANRENQISFDFEGMQNGSISMRCVRFS